ncbi:hypothetical protein HK099_007384 [Clydaea vesicula]|uniref:Tail specific protease domain-containing protein n=1 Tax=Clydaea vesicula TaxID=447962 RepID=A0AAD5Y285_9FUNG|nr:hypothetical protein HK099_007384 [Clydaea vesicula]
MKLIELFKIINVITLLAGVKSQEMNLIPWDSDAQSLYTVPQYLKSTQAKVASSVQNLMQVYCNGESKETYYGIQNPMQTAQKLIDDQGTLTNTKFQSSEMFFFLSLRDFHTNFVLPSPASCFSWIYPIGLDLASSNDLVKNPKVVVKTTRYYSFSNQPKGFSINAGDLVLSINGRTPVQLFQTFAPFAGGANNFGGMRAVLSLFDARSGEMYGPPASEFVTYVFQRPDGSQYTWTGSIFAYYDPQCVNSAPKVASENPEKDPVPKEKLNPYMGVTLDAILGWKFSKPLGFLDFKQTPDAVLGYNIYNFGKNKIGILQLASFIPNTGQNTFIQILISLLQNELSQTNALIIDVRNNGGGLVSLADFLPQIFGGKNIQPMRFRALATPINGNILSNWPDWAEAYQDAVAKKQKYTSKLLSFNSFEDANALGNYYHKPVGVWMNARCYSACDMFVANMKDNKVATIYGEDPQTGAGGANVIDLSFLSAYAPAAFQDSLPAGQTLRVAWRQAVRKNGKLIEDLGVEADVTIRPDPADFANTNSNRNLDKIITDLLSRNNIGIAGGEINFETTLPIKSTDWYGSNFQFSGFIKNVKTLKLAVDGEEVSKLTFNNITEKSNFFVADPQPSTTLGLKVYEVSGLDEESKTVFVQKRYFETLPLLEDFLEVINKNVAVNFAQKNKYSFISTKGNENVGWRLFENVLQLGSVNEKLTYSNKLDTKFKIFLHVQNYKEVNVILKVNGYFDIEYKNDFLNINIKYLTNDSDKTLSNRKVLLKQLTGKGDRIDDILISNLESEFFEISFEFKANEVGGGLEGPKIFDINFESVEKLVSEQDST